MEEKSYSSPDDKILMTQGISLDILEDQEEKASAKGKEIKDSLEFLRIKEAALNAPSPDNKKKIERLKKLISSGEYSVDIDQLSEKITKELI